MDKSNDEQFPMNNRNKNQSSWIASAVKNRSAQAKHSIETARELSSAKLTDPRQAKAAPQPEHRLPNTKLSRLPIERPNPKVIKRHSWLRDFISLAVFVGIVIIGSFLINQFIMRSFNVTGPSMYPTLDGNDGEYTKSAAGSSSDRLIVNMIPVTIDHLTGSVYTPERGQIIVFKNPQYVAGSPDEYIVKRVIGLPGERITVDDCTLLVHTASDPSGFNPYEDTTQYPLFKSVANPTDCVAGSGTDETVPSGDIFVVGDHRDDNGMQWSMDSRNGGGRATLGMIPLKDVVGPVSVRVWPLNKLSLF